LVGDFKYCKMKSLKSPREVLLIRVKKQYLGILRSFTIGIGSV